MIKINPSKALFIKLGRKGKWFEDCKINGYIQLGYHEVNQCGLKNNGKFKKTIVQWSKQNI